MSYRRFGAMIATSTVVMFGLMYLNTYAIEHVRFNQTRMWMALLMGAVMAVVMLGFMWKMYEGRRLKFGILAGASVVFLASLWLVRSQKTVGDVAYMKAMIPHHSIAIMTSERAQIRDPDVRLLADRIIDTQVREIAEMDRMIARLERRPLTSRATDRPADLDGVAAPPRPETDGGGRTDTPPAH